MDLDEKTLNVLACNISVRPLDAAGIAELIPYVRSVQNLGNRLAIDFETAGLSAVDSFVSAERLCCTGITWELVPGGNGVQLTITGTMEQVSMIKTWFD